MTEPAVLYQKTGKIARITLNRPAEMNAIDGSMPGELEKAVALANEDAGIHVIVLTGAGRHFCAGYDPIAYPSSRKPQTDTWIEPEVSQADADIVFSNIQKFMCLWRSPKPTIAKIKGLAAAAGADIAMCCDMAIMSEEARIGYPSTNTWPCPITALWVYRMGLDRAKRVLMTGDMLDGREAKGMHLVLNSVQNADLDPYVDALAQRMASQPLSLLVQQKAALNQTLDDTGITNTRHAAELWKRLASLHSKK